MAAHRVNVLIVDGDARFLEEATAELSGHFTVYTSSTGGDGLKLCAQVRPQVVIADSGISDVGFSDFLNDLKALDAGALRIATSHDYSAIENVMQAIDTSHIHKYFRKPINFFDLIELINARTVSYQVGRAQSAGADIGPAYKKLHTIVDKSRAAEKLGRQLESQLTKIREVEADSFGKVRDALAEASALRKKVADKDALIGSLQAQSQELEQLKKRDIDRVEKERETLRHELKGAKEECDRLSRENAQVGVLTSDNEKLRGGVERLSADMADLRVSVSREREVMTAEMTRERKGFQDEMVRERKAFQDDMALRKDEAERMIEVQKERNRAELQAVQVAFEEERRSAAREIQQLNVDLEKDRAAKLAEVEAGRKRLAAEIAAVEAERKRVEAELAQKKAEAERVVEAQRERNKAELQLVQAAFEDEKRRAGQDIGRRQAEFTADREKKLAAIEASRTRAEEEIGRFQAEFTADRAKKLATLEASRTGAEAEIDRIQAEFTADREARLATINANRGRAEEELAQAEATARRVEEELARKKDEADRGIERQRERNKAELQALADAFKQEHERAAWYQIEQLKAEIEKDREAKLADIEADRRRGEQELGAIRVQMTEEREQLEYSLKEQRAHAEEEIRRVKDSATLERKKLTDALETDLAAMKRAAEDDVEQLRASATRELDRLKAATQKRERELTDALTQAKRMADENHEHFDLAAGKIRSLEFDLDKATREKELMSQELERVRGDYDVLVRSREALKSEVLELRESLK